MTAGLIITYEDDAVTYASALIEDRAEAERLLLEIQAEHPNAKLTRAVTLDFNAELAEEVERTGTILEELAGAVYRHADSDNLTTNQLGMVNYSHVANLRRLRKALEAAYRCFLDDVETDRGARTL